MDELPFTCLTDIEFLRETGAWIYQCTSALNSKDLITDILAGPNKLESCENEGISTESKYYDVKNTAKILKTGNKGFSLLHCNTRSLSKNLPLLNDILLMCKEMPSVIAISETKLSDDNLSNVAIHGYKFISKHSPTNAQRVASINVSKSSPLFALLKPARISNIYTCVAVLMKTIVAQDWKKIMK